MYTLALLRQDLSDRVSLTADPNQVKAWQDSAIKEMIDSTWWRITDVVYTDLEIDGNTQRWFLSGDNISILPPEFQLPPDGNPEPPYYIPYSSVTFRQSAPDFVIVEQTLNFAGVGGGTPVVPLDSPESQALADWTGIGAVVAATPPAPDQRSLDIHNNYDPTKPSKLRLWYQRRVPEPYYPDDTNYVRVSPNFARIATLGFYLGILSDNQAGGDLRLWRKRAEAYLQQAQVIYQETVPIVRNQNQKADDWLVTGRAS